MTLAPGELGSYRPALRPDVLLGPARLRGPATIHLIKDPDSGSSFEVGVKEHFLIARLDGARSLDDIGAEYGQHFGRRLGEQNWQQILALLGTRGLLTGTPDRTEPPAPQPRPRLLEGTPYKGTWRLVADAQAATGRLHRILRPVLRPTVLLPLLVLAAAMEVLLGLHIGELGDGALWVFHRPLAVLAVCLLLWLSITLHELGHAVGAQAYGSRVAEIGMRWQVPMAFMYCTVDDYPYLRSRLQQVVIAGAGAFVNLLFLMPFAAWWTVLPQGSTTRQALSGLLLLGSAQALVNLVPLPPMDGYAMLSNSLGMAGYATETRRYLGLRLSRTPEAKARISAYSRRAHLVYAAYGLGSALICGAIGLGLALLAYRLLVH